MPAFDLVKDQDCTDCVEDNHFLCDCNKVNRNYPKNELILFFKNYMLQNNSKIPI